MKHTVREDVLKIVWAITYRAAEKDAQRKAKKEAPSYEPGIGLDRAIGTTAADGRV